MHLDRARINTYCNRMPKPSLIVPVSIRLTRELRKRVAELAALDGVSLSDAIRLAIRREHERRSPRMSNRAADCPLGDRCSDPMVELRPSARVCKRCFAALIKLDAFIPREATATSVKTRKDAAR